MNDALKSLRQMNKANKLVRFAFKKFGPKSYKRGQGALLQALLDHDGATQRELVDELGVSRGVMKDKGVSCKGKGRKVHRKGHFKKHGHAHGECTHVHHHHHA